MTVLDCGFLPPHARPRLMTRLESPTTTHKILARDDGATTAYCIDSGGSFPGIVFLPGLRSDMGGIKAGALAVHCRENGQTLTRFDYFGHGASSGDFRDGTIGRWLGDALAVVDQLTSGPQILVGSSMGCWIGLLAALARPGRVAGFVGIAGAPDFTEELIWGRLNEEQRHRLRAEGELLCGSAYESGSVPFTWKLIEEGRRHLLMGGPIALACPVRLFHGMADPDVPYSTSLRLAERLSGTGVVVELIEDGDHRMSREADLARLMAALDELSRRVRP
jgi:pimeloyl-ACP methyl ester carboxylesterase